MEIPKTIKMFGYDWKVVLDNKPGGEYNWGKLTIRLEKKWAEEYLIHELLEAVLVNLHCRYSGQEKAMEYLFNFNHTGLCSVAKEFFKVLKDNKLIT